MINNFFKKNKSWLKILLWFTLAVCIISFFTKCNTVKHDQKKLDKIENRHPALMSSELTKLFPPKNDTVVIQGKTIIKKITVTDNSKVDALTNKLNTALSTQEFQNELLNALPAYRQHLIDSVTDNVLQGCGTFETDSVYRTDTIYRTPSTTLAQIDNLKNDTTSKHNRIIGLQNQGIKDNQTIKDRNQLLWIVGGGSVLSLLLLGLAVGKILKKNAV